MSVVLAVDGGGYKTHLALVRDDGSLLAHPLVGQTAKVDDLLEDLLAVAAP